MAKGEVAAMIYSVEFSKFFLKDLLVAIDYLSQYSLSAPERFRERLYTRIENLKTAPKVYAEYPFAPEYRHIVIDKYIAVYRVEEETNRIFMYRLLHGKQDIASYL